MRRWSNPHLWCDKLAKHKLSVKLSAEITVIIITNNVSDPNISHTSTFRLNDQSLAPLVLQQGWIRGLVQHHPPWHGCQLANWNGARSLSLILFPLPRHLLRTPHQMMKFLCLMFTFLHQLHHAGSPCLPRDFPNSKAPHRSPRQKRSLEWASKYLASIKECCKASDLLFVWCQMFGYCTQAGCVWTRNLSQCFYSECVSVHCAGIAQMFACISNE